MSSATTSSARHGLRRKSGMKKHHQRAKCCGNIGGDVDGGGKQSDEKKSGFDKKTPSRLNNVGNLLVAPLWSENKQREKDCAPCTCTKHILRWCIALLLFDTHITSGITISLPFVRRFSSWFGFFSHFCRRSIKKAYRVERDGKSAIMMCIRGKRVGSTGWNIKALEWVDGAEE